MILVMCAVKSVVPSFGQLSETTSVPGMQPFERKREVLGSIAPITVVRMDMGDLADVWPGLRHADRQP